MSAFHTRVEIRFRHCDPAGIVFYPRYFEILNDVVEDFLASVGWGFAYLVAGQGMGVPLASVEARFVAPSRIGDMLDVTVAITRLGRTSAGVSVTFACAGAERVVVDAVMVCVTLDGIQPVPWPPDLRAALAAYAQSD